MLRILAFFLAATAVRAQVSGCCSPAFPVEEVVLFARRLLAQEERPAGRHYFFPAGQPGVGSATDLPNAFYAQQSFEAIRRLTVAVVVFTPIGAVLHHWNHKTRVHTIRILRGEDPLAVEVDGTRLVIVDSQGQLNMVSPRDLSAEEAMQATRSMAQRLRLPSVAAVIRTDPWIFYPSRAFAGIPATWRITDPASPAAAAEEAWVCPLFANLEQKCRRVRGT